MSEHETLNDPPEEPFLDGEPYDHEELCKKGRPKRILAAAVLYNNKVWTGARHADIVSHMIMSGAVNECPPEDAKGFLCDTGLYVRRTPASSIAYGAGQLPEDYDGGFLTSEHLW